MVCPLPEHDNSFTRLFTINPNFPIYYTICLSVCLAVSLSKQNAQTYRLEFWHGGQMEGYLGKLDR